MVFAPHGSILTANAQLNHLGELIAQGAKKNEVKRAAIAVKAWISQLTQEEE